ncbi:MAG: hypothetical protein Q4B60_07790 [Erysipelotrichaceae bacterium]|nr:hypothetical protein [Erysipelotrichaceae bacterium]
MKDKYESVGLNYEIIANKYPNLDEYEEIVNSFLSDPFFKEIGEYLDGEDYALAKDACKGLYLLAQELCLFNLYMWIVEVYEDLEEELYQEAYSHYQEMMSVYDGIRGAFNV